MSEGELVRRCRDGDKTAYEALCRQHGPRLMQVAESLLGNRQDAEDAVQQAFVRLYEQIGSFRGESALGTYLYRILVNACQDLRRRRPRRPVLELEDRMVTHRPPLELRMRLQAAIDSLPDRMRQCFVLFAVHELKQTEIAATLQITVGAVKAHIHQAKARLRPLLREPEMP
ncbi:MAG: RNA polymerase sigma factor [Gemmatimonadota bacterium]